MTGVWPVTCLATEVQHGMSRPCCATMQASPKGQPAFVRLQVHPGQRGAHERRAAGRPRVAAGLWRRLQGQQRRVAGAPRHPLRAPLLAVGGGARRRAPLAPLRLRAEYELRLEAALGALRVLRPAVARRCSAPRCCSLLRPAGTGRSAVAAGAWCAAQARQCLGGRASWRRTRGERAVLPRQAGRCMRRARV